MPKILVEIGPVVLENIFFLNFVNRYLLFCNYFPLEKSGAFEQIWIPFTQRCIVPSSIEIGPVVLEKFFLISPIYLSYLIISPWKMAGPSFEQTSPSPTPSLNDAVCQVCLKLAKWFWKRFLNFVNVFSLFRNYLPLENLEFPLPKDALCQVWLKLEQWMLKFTTTPATTTTTTTTTENGHILISKAHLSLRLRWAKNKSNRNTLYVCSCFSLSEFSDIWIT